MDVLPAQSLASLVIPIAENLRAPHSGVREEIHQRAVATGFDRRLSILTDIVDRSAGLFIDEPDVG